MHVLSLLQNKFGLVFFRLFNGALETSNFRSEDARSAITLLRCFLPENTQRGKIAQVKLAEELGTMSKNRLRWITLARGPIWEIHSLTLMISWLRLFSSCLRLPREIHLNYPCLLLENSCTGFTRHDTVFFSEKKFSHIAMHTKIKRLHVLLILREWVLQHRIFLNHCVYQLMIVSIYRDCLFVFLLLENVFAVAISSFLCKLFEVVFCRHSLKYRNGSEPFCSEPLIKYKQ